MPPAFEIYGTNPARASAIFCAATGSATCASTRPAVAAKSEGSKNANAFYRRLAVFEDLMVFSYLRSDDLRYSPPSGPVTLSILTTSDTLQVPAGTEYRILWSGSGGIPNVDQGGARRNAG